MKVLFNLLAQLFEGYVKPLGNKVVGVFDIGGTVGLATVRDGGEVGAICLEKEPFEGDDSDGLSEGMSRGVADVSSKRDKDVVEGEKQL